HSFDDQGALFDEDGRLNNWWTEEDLVHFHGAAAKLVKQYDAYRPFPDAALNGKLTLSENIADLAGLAAPYDAYRLSLRAPRAPPLASRPGARGRLRAMGGAEISNSPAPPPRAGGRRSEGPPGARGWWSIRMPRLTTAP